MPLRPTGWTLGRSRRASFATHRRCRGRRRRTSGRPSASEPRTPVPRPRARAARAAPSPQYRAQRDRHRSRSRVRRLRSRNIRDRGRSCLIPEPSEATSSGSSERDHLDVGGMDVDPVVGEAGGFGHDERNREEIAECQSVGGSREPPSGEQVHRLHERGSASTTQRRRTGNAPRRPVSRRSRRSRDRRVLDPGNGVVEVHLAALPFDEFVTPFPHHPGPWRGYSNSSMRLVISFWFVAVPRIDDRPEQVEVLDPLSRPVGLDLIGGNAPHFSV